MLASPPFSPLASTLVLAVTRLAVSTSLVLKVAVPVAVTVSVPTNPVATMVNVGVAVVVPSYTLLGAAIVAVSAFGVMVPAPVAVVGSV